MAIEMETSSLDNSFETKMKKEKEERQKVAPIVSKDQVIRKKETLGQKIKKAFIPEDLRDVADYFFRDLFVPGVKNAALDVLEHLFFPSDRSYRRDYDYGKSAKTSYASYYRSTKDYDDSPRRKRNYEDREKEKSHDYRNIVIQVRNRREKEEMEKKAKKVVHNLRQSVREYGNATVAQLLDSVGLDSEWTDEDYGWSNENDICLREVRDGYLIDVPEAHYIGE